MIPQSWIINSLKMYKISHDYSHQKWYWQHEDQQNENKQKSKMGRKTTFMGVLNDS